MSTNVDINFDELKRTISFEQVLGMLGVSNLKIAHDRINARCPVCKNDSLKITPSKGLCNCFTRGCPAHGDQIGLVAAAKGYSGKGHMRRAAEDITAHFGNMRSAPSVPQSTVPNTSPPALPVQGGEPKPLGYLQYTEAVGGLGISEDTCTAFGAGYAPKGLHRGKFAIVLRDRFGRYIVNQASQVQYLGLAMGENQSPRLNFADGFDPRPVIFNAHKAVTSQDFQDTHQLILVRDPLEVMIAHERGSENVISFLTMGISAEQLGSLQSLMDENACETIESY